MVYILFAFLNKSFQLVFYKKCAFFIAANRINQIESTLDGKVHLGFWLNFAVIFFIFYNLEKQVWNGLILNIHNNFLGKFNNCFFLI